MSGQDASLTSPASTPHNLVPGFYPVPVPAPGLSQSSSQSSHVPVPAPGLSQSSSSSHSFHVPVSAPGISQSSSQSSLVPVPVPKPPTPLASTFSLSSIKSSRSVHPSSPLFFQSSSDYLLPSPDPSLQSAFDSIDPLLIQQGHIILNSTSSLPLDLLVDSGADQNFLSTTFVLKHNIPVTPLTSAVSLQLADGSISTLTTRTLPLTLRIGSHEELITFLVTPLTRPAILGYPWLSQHNPSIHWPSKSLIFNLSSSPKLCELIYPNFPSTTEPPLDCNLPQALMFKYKEVFSKEKALSLPPHRGKYDFRVDLKENVLPPSSKTYNLTGEEKLAMKQWIDENLAQGFIRPCHSPYAAPCFFIKKKDGELRLCMDYRKLNSITIKTNYPLPRIPEIIIKVGNGKWYSALDLRGAYNRIRVAEGDEHKLSFITNYGQFEFLVMPFGPCAAPGYFQAFMNSLLSHLPFVSVYLDDIIISSLTQEEHFDHIAVVLEILLKNELYCKLPKCQFFQTSLSYLGYIISTEGVAMDPKKLSAIATWPAPTSRKELESFLGFTNFYRAFIPHYSDLTCALTDLLSKDSKFSWSDTSNNSFLKLKASFTNAISLHHPKDNLPFEVECDSSDYALGAVLSQRISPERLVPIAFYARKLTQAEKNYPIYDKELLSIHESFQEWRHFLQGGPYQVKVWSDHKSLSYFMTTKQLTRRHARWSLFFSSFDFVIMPRPGSENAQADALSRRADFISDTTENSFSLLSPDHFSTVLVEANAVLSATTAIPFAILHARFGHPGSVSLKRTIATDPSIRPTGNLEKTLCDPCSRGKSKRKPFGRTSSRKYDVLEVLSADIQYFSTISNDGTSANIKIIDHATKYLKTFLLKDRSAATLLEDLAPFIARMERQAGKLVKFIRTDQGGEFGGVVLDFLAAKGIVRQKTTPYYHIDPGMAEHAHQTVLYMARSILIASNLPLLFYGDAILTATYLHNRIVHSGASKTPFELMKGRPPRLDHLRPFGSLAYVHVPAETRSKLAPAAIRCRLIGYGDDDDVEEIRGYKFVTESDISYIIYSTDARFDENATPLPIPGHEPFDFSTQGEEIFGDPSYSDSEDGEETEYSRTL